MIFTILVIFTYFCGFALSNGATHTGGQTVDENYSYFTLKSNSIDTTACDDHYLINKLQTKINRRTNSIQSNKQERTLILLKPDAVERKIVGKIIERFENKGLKLVAMKLFKATRMMAEDHYREHKDQPFFGDLMEYMTARPLIPMVWEGPNVIISTRNMLGVHDPTVSAPGTIRGDFSTDIQNNVIHGSDCVSAANREIDIWFHESEVMPVTTNI